MRPYRPQRNRRRPDPMNYIIGPHGCAVRCDSDNATPSTITVDFNCSVNATTWDWGSFLFDGNAPDGPPEQTTATRLTFTTAAPTGSATPAECIIGGNQPFGPNVTAIDSYLYINVA